MNMPTQKIALITGGSRGLGRNTAESLARRGVDVMITYHSRADEGRTVVTAVEAHGRKAVALQLDTAAVARLLGRSPGAVRVAAHRGLRRLAENLSRAGVTL